MILNSQAQSDFEKDTLEVYQTFERAGEILHANPDSTINLIHGALEKSLEINYVNGISESYGWLGYLYQYIGDYAKAMSFYQKGVAFDRTHGNKVALATDLLNLGSLVSDIGKDEEALKLYKESLELYLQAGQEQEATSNYNNIGVYFSDNEMYDSAVHYFQQSLKYADLNQDSSGYSDILGNLGFVQMMLGNRDQSAKYFRESIHISRLCGDFKSLSYNYGTYAQLLLEENQLDSALYFANQSAILARKAGSDYMLMLSYKSLRSVHEALENWEQAYRYMDSSTVLTQRLMNEDLAHEALSTTFRLEYEKKMVADSINNLNEMELQNARHQADLEHERNIQTWMFGGIGVAILLLGFMFVANRNRRKANQLISQQKNEVARQRDIAEEQKAIVEEKNREITDSIVYAQRLQQAILPKHEQLNELLGEHFVYYVPKDIVAGDFYWVEPDDDNGVYLCAADCTGHGVPGAMVSVVGSNALSKALLEEGITDVAKILDRTRELVIERFRGAGEGMNEVRDGMDAALCHIRGNEVTFSGANNPLWVVSKNEIAGADSVLVHDDTRDWKLYEFKADKQPIGKYEGARSFSKRTTRVTSGDMIYIFSDGYADQFGGENLPAGKAGGKKYKSTNLKRLLLELADFPMDEQADKLHTNFMNWKGDLEQVDDICIIGLRISGS